MLSKMFELAKFWTFHKFFLLLFVFGFFERNEFWCCVSIIAMKVAECSCSLDGLLSTCQFLMWCTVLVRMQTECQSNRPGFSCFFYCYCQFATLTVIILLEGFVKSLFTEQGSKNLGRWIFGWSGERRGRETWNICRRRTVEILQEAAAKLLFVNWQSRSVKAKMDCLCIFRDLCKCSIHCICAAET